jgi:Mg/Co/Ni transporter MgtE
MLEHGNLFFFTPLIAAMAGNVELQSSAIIVQGLANNTLSGSLFNRLIKNSIELAQRIMSAILFAGSYFHIRRATYYWFCDLLCFTICNYYCFLNGNICAFVII